MQVLPFVLDRSSTVPLYVQVAEYLESAIAQGVLAPGDRLDNEISQATRFGLSPPTMRHAIEVLVEKGLLVRRRGIGTLVVQGRITRPTELTGLVEDLRERHHIPTTRVLLNEVTAATAAVAARLSVPVGVPVLHLRRLRVIDQEPLAILENYFPQDLIGLGETDLTTGGLYHRLRSCGIHIRVARQRIGARAATAKECMLLAERRGTPVLTVERAGYDNTGRIVEWGRHAYRANRYTVQTTLVSR